MSFRCGDVLLNFRERRASCLPVSYCEDFMQSYATHFPAPHSYFTHRHRHGINLIFGKKMNLCIFQKSDLFLYLFLNWNLRKMFSLDGNDHWQTEEKSQSSENCSDHGTHLHLRQSGGALHALRLVFKWFLFPSNYLYNHSAVSLLLPSHLIQTSFRKLWFQELVWRAANY